MIQIYLFTFPFKFTTLLINLTESGRLEDADEDSAPPPPPDVDADLFSSFFDKFPWLK